MRHRLIVLLSGLAVFALVAIGCGGGSSTQSASDFAESTCKNFQSLATTFEDVVSDLNSASDISTLDGTTQKKISSTLGSLDTALGKLSSQINQEKSPAVKSGDDVKKQMVAAIDKLRTATKTLRTKVDNFDVNNPSSDDLSSLSDAFDSFGSDFSSNGDKFDSAFSDDSEVSKASHDSKVCQALNSDFSS